jgi:hypothetical protein
VSNSRTGRASRTSQTCLSNLGYLVVLIRGFACAGGVCRRSIERLEQRVAGSNTLSLNTKSTLRPRRRIWVRGRRARQCRLLLLRRMAGLCLSERPASASANIRSCRLARLISSICARRVPCHPYIRAIRADHAAAAQARGGIPDDRRNSRGARLLCRDGHSAGCANLPSLSPLPAHR